LRAEGGPNRCHPASRDGKRTGVRLPGVERPGSGGGRQISASVAPPAASGRIEPLAGARLALRDVLGPLQRETSGRFPTRMRARRATSMHGCSCRKQLETPGKPAAPCLQQFSSLALKPFAALPTSFP